jgi:hypothetical protein
MFWYDSPIVHYNVSRSANTLMGAMAFMALFGGLQLGWLWIGEIKESKYRKWSKTYERPTWPRNVPMSTIIIALSLFTLASCAGVKKDCNGIKHYRTKSGVYVKVKCDLGHCHPIVAKAQKPEHNLFK